MSPEEIDQAIDALPEHEQEMLFDAAVQHWRFRVQNWALPIVLFTVTSALFFAIAGLIQPYWPRSLVAATLATLTWLGIFYGLLRFVLSMRFAQWRIRWATRREYKHRSGAA